MSPAADAPFEIDFRRAGNSDAFVAEGWSAAEPNHRWTIGQISRLTAPPFDFPGDGALGFSLAPYPSGGEGPAPTLTVVVNGRGLGAIAVRPSRFDYRLCVPFGTLRADRVTLIEFHLDHRPAIPPAERKDKRDLGLMVWTLTIEPWPGELFAKPARIPHATRARIARDGLRGLGLRFQSLGVNCEFGLAQRKMGAEPLGLLRFAFIDLTVLIRGIETGFAGIEDPANLDYIVHKDSRELMGRHGFYGLDYHTERFEGEVDIAEFKRQDVRRLAFLARRLMAEIAGAEKIFVIQREFLPISLDLALGVLRALRRHNPGVSLLWVARDEASAPENVGRVERLGPGFYRGYIDRLAPIENAFDFSFAPWLRICAAVAAFEDGRAPAGDAGDPADDGLDRGSVAEAPAMPKDTLHHWPPGPAGRLTLPPVNLPGGALIMLRAARAAPNGGAGAARVSIVVNAEVVAEIILTRATRVFGIFTPAGVFRGDGENSVEVTAPAPIAEGADEPGARASSTVLISQLYVEGTGGQVIGWDDGEDGVVETDVSLRRLDASADHGAANP